MLTLKPIKVLIVDDHEVVCRGTKSFLDEDPEIEVVGLAFDGYSAVSLAQSLTPDLALVDFNLPGLNGIETTKKLKLILPTIKVITFSGYNEEHYVKALLMAGADGFLLKTISQKQLIEAIKKVNSNLQVLYPVPASGRRSRTDLTVREVEILDLLAEGLSNKEIGNKLSLSSRTVEFHVANLLAKLDVQSRLGAVTEARKRGLLTNI